MTPVRDAQRRTRTASCKPQAMQRAQERAEEDYQRLRSAYLAMTQRERGNEVALAMVGADMERAHAALQQLDGLQPLPRTRGPGANVLRQPGSLAGQQS